MVAIGLAHKAGIKISFWQFAKYGIPVTLVSVAMVAPYILIRYLCNVGMITRVILSLSEYLLVLYSVSSF